MRQAAAHPLAEEPAQRRRSPRLFWGALVTAFCLVATVVFIVTLNLSQRFSAANGQRSLASGKQKIPVAKDFDRLFPATEHSISYYSGTHGEPTWNAVAGLHGRYILIAKVKIRIRRSDGEIIGWEPPEFWLNEVEKIDGLPDGRTYVSYDREGHLTFGPGEWELVVKQGGDLSVLGKQIEKNQPVQGFEQIWRTGG
jgi:hypothetical protein